MSISISVSWSGRWMMMLSGEWLAPCQARSIRSPPISRVRRSWNVSSFGRPRRVVVAQQQPPGLLVSDAGDVLVEEGRRAGVVGVVVRVDEVRDLVADAVGRGDLVDGPLDVVADGRRRVEQDDAVRGGQERRLVGAVGDPVEVPLDAADVVALLVEGGAERRSRDRRVVGEDRRGHHHPAHGSAKAPSWLPMAAMSSKAHCSVILPSSLTR